MQRPLPECNVEDLLGKLDGIARTLRHEPGIAQAAPLFYPMRFQLSHTGISAVCLFPNRGV